MNSTTDNNGLALLQQGAQAPSVLITEDHLLDLPEVAQRYLRYAQVVGKEPIRTVRLRQRGFMRRQPQHKWMPLVAAQYYTTNPPAFLWHSMIRPFPLVWIAGWDRFSKGHSNLLIKLCSLITLGDARGLEMDQGELLRYLGEMVWFPTAWLFDTIQWQAIDAHSVQVTLRQPSITASAILHVNEQGQVTQVTAERYLDEREKRKPWLAQLLEYQEVEGMHIPTRVDVAWHLASGEFNYFQCKITEIEYNQSGKATRF